MLSYRTAGESHGPTLLALVEGLPAGLAVDTAFIDAELARRQGGYGRGGRQRIETDVVRVLTGVRAGIKSKQVCDGFPGQIHTLGFGRRAHLDRRPAGHDQLAMRRIDFKPDFPDIVSIPTFSPVPRPGIDRQ